MKLKVNYKGLIKDTVIHLPLSNKLGLEFFPEGGELIEGLNSRIAFIAQSNNGMRFDIAGSLHASKRGIIGSIKTEQDGMGLFSLIPQEDECYYVVVESPTSVIDTFYLPSVRKKGWSLQAAETGGMLTIGIGHNYEESRKVLVTVVVRDFLVKYTIREVSSYDGFSIDINEIPPGIAVVTLFDEIGKPIAETLVYLHQKKQG